jgi:hypothetical protein
VCSRRSRIGVSLIAFGGLNWALDGASAPVAAVARLGPAMAPLGARGGHGRPPRQTASTRSLHDQSFSYPGSERRCCLGLDLTVPTGTSLAIVGQNGAARPHSPSCSAASTTQPAGQSWSTESICAASTFRLASQRRRGLPGLRPLRAVAA